MPSKTPKQARAMAAACHGKSTIGIPKKVACEYNRHDKGTGILKGKRKKR
jgi:hypothetical protein